MTTVKRTVTAGMKQNADSGVAVTVSSLITTTDTVGDIDHNSLILGYAEAIRVVATANGTLASVGVDVQTADGNIRVAIYADNAGQPGALIAESASTAVSGTGWNDVALVVPIVQGTVYWLGLQSDSAIFKVYYHWLGTYGYQRFYVKSYGAFDNPYSAASLGQSIIHMRMIYTGPPAGTYVFRNGPAAQRLYAGPIGVTTVSVGVNYVRRLAANQNIGLRSRSIGYGAITRVILTCNMAFAATVSAYRKIPRIITSFGIKLAASAIRKVTLKRSVIARILLTSQVARYRSVARTITGTNITLAASAISNYRFRRSISTFNITFHASATRNADKHRTVTAAMKLSAEGKAVVRRLHAALRVMLRMRGEVK